MLRCRALPAPGPSQVPPPSRPAWRHVRAGPYTGRRGGETTPCTGTSEPMSVFRARPASSRRYGGAKHPVPPSGPVTAQSRTARASAPRDGRRRAIGPPRALEAAMLARPGIHIASGELAGWNGGPGGVGGGPGGVGGGPGGGRGGPSGGGVGGGGGGGGGGVAVLRAVRVPRPRATTGGAAAAAGAVLRAARAPRPRATTGAAARQVGRGTGGGGDAGGGAGTGGIDRRSGAAAERG